MKHILACILVMLFSVQLNAQKKIINTSLSKQAIVADLDEYARDIDLLHVDPYANIKRTEFFDRIERLKAAADSISTDELLVRWMQLNALLGDAHTHLVVMMRYQFPFVTHWYNEGLYIIATNLENAKCYQGKITAINDMSVEAVVKRVRTIIDSDRIYQQLPGFVTSPVLLYGLHITSERTKATYTITAKDGSTFKVSPPPMDIRDQRSLTGTKPWHFLRTERKAKYWFKYIDTMHAIYFNYSSCKDDGTLTQVLSDLEAAIDERKPKKIIIDLRYNGGGYARLLQPLIHYLVASPLNRSGGIYVLIGPRTFSAAVLNSQMLRDETRAIFVGEPAGQGPSFTAGIKRLKLPNTGIELIYSTKHINPDLLPDTFQPDVKIVETFADYDNDVDAVVDYALTH